MDRKIYEKTRYDNIYRHKKNKNYIIMINKPKKTSVARNNGEKIYDIEVAKSINMKISLNLKSIEKQSNSEYFKDLWQEYINYCTYVKKLNYNTIKKKKTLYKCYLYELNNQRITRMTKTDIAYFISSLNTSDKQKNAVLIILKAFFTWCEEEKEIINNKPTRGIKTIRVPRTEMKYWTSEEFSKFINYLKNQDTYYSHMIRILTLIGLYIGDRIGETRALTWSSIDEVNNTIRIAHSINYDPDSNDYLSVTKNYYSDRISDVSPNLIKELQRYKDYLLDIHININDIIFFNYKNNKPYSDTNLRKHFYNFCDKAKVKRIRMYDLRHTFTTMLSSDGWELHQISPILGHKNYSTTVNTYMHLEKKIRKEIAKTTDKYL